MASTFSTDKFKLIFEAEFIFSFDLKTPGMSLKPAASVCPPPPNTFANSRA